MASTARDARQLIVSPAAADRVAQATAWMQQWPADAEILVIAASWDAADDVARAMVRTSGARFGTTRCTLGALAGILVGLNYNAIQPYMGEVMMLKGFAVIILGGLGDIRGALVAGLAVGLLENLTAGYFASSWKDAVGFVLLVLTP